MKNEKQTNYVPPKVNRWYRYDWQYAVDISKTNSLIFASLVLLIVPLVLRTEYEIPLNVWLLWVSSAAFVASLIILNLRCPKFVKEYRDFGQYQQRQHSHRFIVWEFYGNLKSLRGWKTIVQETLAKKVSIDENHPTYLEEINKIPAFRDEVINEDDVIIQYPVNIDRDIYLPIGLYGKKILLLMKEDEAKLKEKEKELYWILYSCAVKERTFWRILYWIFIHISILSSFAAILNNISKVFR
jgi:hypothetical protein